MKLIITTISLLALSLAHHCMAADNPFVGQWQPDMEATIANAKKNPKFTEEDSAKMEQILPQIVGAMRLEMTPTSLTMRFGKSREQTTSYTVKSVNESEVALELQVSDSKTIDMTLTPVGDKNLSLQIEGNNDMAIYVWKPANSMDAKDPNMAAATAAMIGGKPSKAKENPVVTIEESIQNNLRIIYSAAEQYSLENGVISVAYSELEGKYFKSLTSLNGESYKGLTIQLRDKKITVIDKDGKSHTFKRR